MKDTLTSLQNPKVKQVVRLRERREREKSGLFLIEGYRELLRASESEHPIETLFICESLFLGTNEPALIHTLQALGAEVISCAEHVFRKMSYRDRPDGLLAIAPKKQCTLESLEQIIAPKKAPFLVVAEAIEKPGNLGTILRSCDAAGVDALIVCDPCTDLFNPNVVRASIGTLFTVPVAVTTRDVMLEWLKTHGIALLAATPDTDLLYTDVNLTVPLAWAVGTEQLGLTDALMDAADKKVRIPMQGRADSLNVATATTILLFETLRQRQC